MERYLPYQRIPLSQVKIVHKLATLTQINEKEQEEDISCEAIVLFEDCSIILKVFGADINLLTPGNALKITNGQLEPVLGYIRLVVRAPFSSIELIAQNEDSNYKSQIRKESLSKDKLNLSFIKHEYTID